MDGRTRPGRIASVIAALDADVVALQEVVRGGAVDQAEWLADELGYEMRFGQARLHLGGGYGNATMSRLPFVCDRTYDITAGEREGRCCLRTDLRINLHRDSRNSLRTHRTVEGAMRCTAGGAAKKRGAKCLSLFNLHLGTGLRERREQARKLVSPEILGDPETAGGRIVLGDFNEWTRGLATELMSAHLKAIDVSKFSKNLARGKSYPGVLPVLHLDHVYFDEAFTVSDVTLHRTRLSIMASDHLPIVVDFEV